MGEGASLGPALGTRPLGVGVGRGGGSADARGAEGRSARPRVEPDGDSARPAPRPHPHAQAQSRCRPGSREPSGFRNSPAAGLDRASSEVRGAAGPKPRRPPPAASSVSRQPWRSSRRAPGQQPRRCWRFQVGGASEMALPGKVKAEECRPEMASGGRAGPLQRQVSPRSPSMPAKPRRDVEPGREAGALAPGAGPASPG